MTIGAYGFAPDAFFDTLASAGVDVFLDVRQRRGMRGERYAFANARRLEAELESRGIAYRHVKDLAPDTETRQLQKAADAAGGVTKSGRALLTPTFVEQWERRNGDPFDWSRLVASLATYRVPAIFCVEREPDACHRSLAALRLADAAGVEVQHLVP